MMADVWLQNWRERLRALPAAEAWHWQLEQNADAEHITCILCDHGHEESAEPPEWIVSYRVTGGRISKGLHEQCRQLNAPPPEEKP